MYNHLYLYHFFTYITCTINRYKDISLYSWLFDSHASTAIKSNRIWLISVPFDPIFTWCFTWNNEYIWSTVFPAFHAAVVYTLNIVWLEIEIEMSSRAEQPRAASFRNVAARPLHTNSAWKSSFCAQRDLKIAWSHRNDEMTITRQWVVKQRAMKVLKSVFTFM